jgi:hypothetical protein
MRDMQNKHFGVLAGSLLIGGVALAFVIVNGADLRGANEAPAGKPTSPQGTLGVAEVPPVQVLVRRVEGSGRIQYAYRVVNGSAFPITAFLVGFDSFHNESELLLLGDEFPPTDRTSPPGWVFNVQPTEEDSLGCIKWEISAEAYEILGGNDQGGFSVILSAPDSKYETGQWTVHLNSAAQSHYYGSLAPDAETAVPPSSLFGQTDVQVSPNPSNSKFAISFQVPTEGSTMVVICNVQGKRVAEILNQHLLPGEASAEWDGRDASGSKVAPGTYFVHIKTASTERFVRLIWTK